MDIDNLRSQLASLTPAQRRRQIEIFNQVIEEVQEEQPSDEDDAAMMHSRQQFSNMVNPKRFPSNTNGMYGHRDSQGEIDDYCDLLNPLLDVIRFPNLPKFVMKGDVDSIYGYSCKLNDLLESFHHSSGDGLMESMFIIPSTTSCVRKSYSSRFFLDTNSLSTETILFQGRKAAKISLDRFPNIEIGSLSVGLHRPMQIYLYNIGCSVVYKEYMFNKTEMAVINCAINIARKLSLEECNVNRNKEMAKSFQEFSRIKSCYGIESKRTATRDINELSLEEMKLFSLKFHEALELIADEEQHDFKIIDPENHGIRSDDEFVPSKTEMICFAQELQKGMVFVASISGIKKYFNKNDFSLDSETDNEEYKRDYSVLLDIHEDDVVMEANEALCQEYEIADIDDLVNVRNLPEGVTKFVKRPLPSENDEDFINRSLPPPPEGSRYVQLQDIDHSWDCFENIFLPEWRRNMLASFEKDIGKMCKKLHRFLTFLFKVNPNRPCPIFFYIGVEIRLLGKNTLLIDIDKAFPVITSISNLQ